MYNQLDAAKDKICYVLLVSKIILPQERNPINRVRHLVDNLNRLADPSPEIDISEVRYITPLTILPLASRISDYGSAKPRLVSKSDRPIETLNSIKFPSGVAFLQNEPGSVILDHRPIYKVSVDWSDGKSPVQNLNSIAQEISNLVRQHLGDRGEVADNYAEAVSYYLSEISDNIHEHAEAKFCWIYFKFWKARGELEFCIVDDGIGIKQRYDKSGFGTRDHVDALEQAIRGNSTKTPERGYGIGTMINLFTSHDARGQVCIISGNACYLNSFEGTKKLGKISAFWRGVIFSIRLVRPINRIKVVKYASI